MAVSIRKATRDIFKDKDFLSKYTVLVILAFCVGLLSFAMIAKNNMWILVSLPFYILAGIILNGYYIKYTHNLMDNENSGLPSIVKENLLEYFPIGLRYFIATAAFLAINSLAVISLMILISFLAKIYNLLIVLIILPIIYEIVLLLYIFVGLPGLIYNFIESNYSILSFFEIKKVLSHLSVNYFISLFYLSILNLGIFFMTQCSIMRIRYALLLIIPLMLSPIVALITDNLMAQAYRSNKTSEEGSIAKMSISLLCLIILSIVLAVGYFIIKLKFGL